MKEEFKNGDIVVLISDDAIKYTIVSLYGNGNSICKYYDRKAHRNKELSVPLVALKKHKGTTATKHVHHPVPKLAAVLPASSHIRF